jgi:hypothetical protein
MVDQEAWTRRMRAMYPEMKPYRGTSRAAAVQCPLWLRDRRHDDRGCICERRSSVVFDHQRAWLVAAEPMITSEPLGDVWAFVAEEAAFLCDLGISVLRLPLSAFESDEGNLLALVRCGGNADAALSRYCTQRLG